MKDNRWPKLIYTLSQRARRPRGLPEIKWETEVERVMKQRIVVSDDAENWQLWLPNVSNRRTTGKLITYIHRIWVTIIWALRNRVSFYVLPPQKKPLNQPWDPPSLKGTLYPGVKRTGLAADHSRLGRTSASTCSLPRVRLRLSSDG